MVGGDESIWFLGGWPVNLQNIGFTCLYFGGQQIFWGGLYSPHKDTISYSTALYMKQNNQK